MSVMENIFLGDLPVRSGFVSTTAKAKTKALIDEFGLPIDPTVPVASLPSRTSRWWNYEGVPQQPRHRLEPTAPLTDKEIDILFGLISSSKSRKIVLYVSTA